MRCGHSFCKGFKRPFDDVFIKSIQDTALYLAKNVSGCVLTYQQSDEISMLLIDYQTLKTQAFFDYEVQKICSITASMATMAFNNAFNNNVVQFTNQMIDNDDYDEYEKAIYVYTRKLRLAMFDSRCFNIPREEVTNYFYWRQFDATRNSIQMVGQANFSHKELQNKSCNDIQNMLFNQKNMNWNDLPAYQKRGSCCIKEYYTVNDVKRSRWSIDRNIPIFKDDGREYIERLVQPELE